MLRFWACFFCLILTTTAPRALAQVIECPGGLPIAKLEKEQTIKLAERLLGRFTAALGLHGLNAVDETAIVESYRNHPEQLLTKLTYLSLQCQMVLLDSAMTAGARSQAVRRVFLNYVLQPADIGSESLASYVNQVAANSSSSGAGGVDPAIARIELALLQSARYRWAENFFIERPERTIGTPPPRWSVIIASPRFEDDGWQALRGYQERFPDIHFELDGPFDLDSPHYAIVAGRGLGEAAANQLLEQVKKRGLPSDSFIWKAPAPPPANGDS